MGSNDKLRAFFHDTRGTVTTEYVVLLGAIGLAAMVALIAVGPALMHHYLATRTVIAAPFP